MKELILFALLFGLSFGQWSWGELYPYNRTSQQAGCLSEVRTPTAIQAFQEGSCWGDGAYVPRIVQSNSSGLIFDFYNLTDRSCGGNITKTIFFPFEVCVEEPLDVFSPPEDNPVLGDDEIFFVARVGGVVGFPPLPLQEIPIELQDENSRASLITLYYPTSDCANPVPDSILYRREGDTHCDPIITNSHVELNTLSTCQEDVLQSRIYDRRDATCSGDFASFDIPLDFCIAFANNSGFISRCNFVNDSQGPDIATILGIALAVAACCCLIFFAVGIGLFLKKVRSRSYFEFALASIDEHQLTYLEGPYENLRRINGGHAGDIFVGEYEGTLFALKSLKLNSEESTELFRNEINALSELQHPNIIRFWGIYNDNITQYMVLDYMECGSLLEFLKITPDVPKQDLFQITLSISLGMQVLEKKGFIHRDLACRNILIDKAFSVKITDFGLTQKIPSTGIFPEEKKRPIPTRWSAPEVIDAKIYLLKSDVWSWAVTIWELFSAGEIPARDISNNQILKYMNERKKEKLPYLDKPDAMPQLLYGLLSDCWKPNPNARPNFKDIVQTLKSIGIEKQKTITDLHSEISLEVSEPFSRDYNTKDLQEENENLTNRVNQLYQQLRTTLAENELLKSQLAQYKKTTRVSKALYNNAEGALSDPPLSMYANANEE